MVIARGSPGSIFQGDSRDRGKDLVFKRLRESLMAKNKGDSRGTAGGQRISVSLLLRDAVPHYFTVGGDSKNALFKRLASEMSPCPSCPPEKRSTRRWGTHRVSIQLGVSQRRRDRAVCVLPRGYSGIWPFSRPRRLQLKPQLHR